METTYNENETNIKQQAQALICIDAFNKICTKSIGHFTIVPLKGIDLIRFLYADKLDRELKDIDLLVFPSEKAMDFIGMMQNDGYQAEFSFALDEAALKKKRKVSMISPSKLMPNVDVHIALITKKFFSSTINGFNQDAISRLKVVNEVVSVLDNVDRWLYLAAHLTFHFLDGEKWYRDLILLMERFNEEEKSTLVKRAEQYNFERVVGAVCARMRNPIFTQLLADKSGKRFLRYIDFMAAHPQRLGHGLHLARYYWEFVFISNKKQRCRSYLSLMLPELGIMQNIYRCHKLFAILLYLPHILINSLGIFLFLVQYHIISTLYNE